MSDLIFLSYLDGSRGHKLMNKVDLKYYRIPKKVKIGGFNYEIIFPHRFEETSNFMGLHCTEDLQIFLTPYNNSGFNSLTSRPAMHECLLHEILHGIDAVYLDDDMDHREIYLLSQTLHQVLHDNVLNIKDVKKPLPKKVKIGGVVYAVSLGHFKEIDSNCAANAETCTLKISRDITNLHYQRGLLIFGLIALIFSKLKLFDPEISSRSVENNRDFRSFSKGLYQVIVDNNLEEIIKDG